MSDFSIADSEHVSLLEIVDRVLNKGAVISGQALISVADVELIRLGLELVISSTDTLLKATNASTSALHEENRSAVGPESQGDAQEGLRSANDGDS